MIKKIPSDAMPITIRGMKKIEDDDELMELSEYIGIYSGFHTIPKKIVFTKKIGNTVYDVTAHFDIDGKQSVLEQFKRLLLSQD